MAVMVGRLFGLRDKKKISWCSALDWISVAPKKITTFF